MSLRDDLAKVRAIMLKEEEAWKKERTELWNGMSEKQRLAAADTVFRAIVENSRRGGSFRCLIYNTLGFGYEAYAPLYNAGGMIINNELDLQEKEEEKHEVNSTE